MTDDDKKAGCSDPVTGALIVPPHVATDVDELIGRLTIAMGLPAALVAPGEGQSSYCSLYTPGAEG